MNERDNFLTRWSRRKRGAVAGSAARDEPPVSERSNAPDRDDAPDRRGPPADAPERPAEAGGPVVDLTKLPAIDSITAQTDISGFLVAGVPEELKAAALRRAWVADPRIRDFVGLADYDWDFHTPGAIPGFGPLAMNDDLRREIARIVGSPISEPEPAKPEPSQDVAVPNEDVAPRAIEPGADGLRQATEMAGQEIAAVQPDIPQSENVQAPATRSHGGALPK
jgi:hypothetical protein